MFASFEIKRVSNGNTPRKLDDDHSYFVIEMSDLPYEILLCFGFCHTRYGSPAAAVVKCQLYKEKFYSSEADGLSRNSGSMPILASAMR